MGSPSNDIVYGYAEQIRQLHKHFKIRLTPVFFIMGECRTGNAKGMGELFLLKSQLFSKLCYACTVVHLNLLLIAIVCVYLGVVLLIKLELMDTSRRRYAHGAVMEIYSLR
ncbi:hypothetical protein D1872_310280 [compost metagenome]